MKHKHLLSIPLILIFLLGACSYSARPTGTPSAVPTETAAPAQASCPLGTWQVQNFDSVMQTILTNALSQTGTIGDVNSSGTLQYTFGSDGKLTARADQFQVQAPLSVSGLSVNVQVDIAGSASADFSVDQGNDTITYSNFDPGDLSISATAGGFSPNQQIDPGYLMLGASQSASAQFACQNGTLQISLPIAEAQGQAVILVPANP